MKKKTKWLIGVIILLIIVAVACCFLSNKKSVWRTYTNEAYHYSFGYPSNFTVGHMIDERGGDSAFIYSDKDKFVGAFSGVNIPLDKQEITQRRDKEKRDGLSFQPPMVDVSDVVKFSVDGHLAYQYTITTGVSDIKELHDQEAFRSGENQKITLIFIDANNGTGQISLRLNMGDLVAQQILSTFRFTK